MKNYFLKNLTKSLKDTLEQKNFVFKDLSIQFY